MAPRSTREFKGQKFNHWFVLSYAGYRSRHHYWLCRCDCGRKREIQENDLIINGTTQCSSCASIEKMKTGRSGPPSVRKLMFKRATDPTYEEPVYE